MQEIILNLNITIGDLTEETENRIVSLVEKLSKTTKTTPNVKTQKKQTKKSKPKIKNSEKEITKKKQEIMGKITKNPDTLFAKVAGSIFRRIRFTLQELNEEFSKENPSTIRSYVNDLKNAGILQEMDRGKYFVLK